MKKLVFAVAAIFAISSTAIAMEHDHSKHNMSGVAKSGGVAHEEVVEGVKVTFKVQTMADAMKGMGMEMPVGVKETHHISLSLKDAKGVAITEGNATIKVQNPDKSAQTKDMIGMHGHFGADVLMGVKGKYGVMCKFQTKDGKVRNSKFWYTVK